MFILVGPCGKDNTEAWEQWWVLTNTAQTARKGFKPCPYGKLTFGGRGEEYNDQFI